MIALILLSTLLILLVVRAVLALRRDCLSSEEANSIDALLIALVISTILALIFLRHFGGA
ncbi:MULTISPECIES: hypothetical protein [Bifidobacterium]|jgi:spore maturation protein SpmA|uniref:Uncharacterized protein n=1 Tax=Bifidobacterium subtile TaxID=77635 RepID=A0A087E5R9_9BIFI|nr:MULTISPECIES: hypothetical protein [Bifidobacterium]KFJ03120.1 hypothetical protein BISU_1052 [Bifidobacterium subtile]MCH3974396.1 hypothetical protein [Bifidobacterium tibiigranuli]MCI1712690.1 hypothetical protein [Bifidobacterium tibiigranuli]MCI1792209.1 hypothetical protein [Bifidobacterium tibiigranuli]QOL37342.1 hypothetical protein BS3272_05500 [Bifidobacterium subtile]